MNNVKDELKLFIKNNMEFEHKFFRAKRSMVSSPIYAEYEMCESALASPRLNGIDDFLNQSKDYSDFQTLLFKYIDDRELKDSDVYNKVHIDRRLFSKIRSDNTYHPSKDTIILLGLSLELSEKEMENLLESASYSLPKNNHFDLIIRFCFMKGIYNLSEVNELLDSYNCRLFNY